MNSLTQKTDLVFKAGDEVCTTSLIVAERFGKRHKNVIKKIEGFAKDTFTRLQIKPSNYIDSRGKQDE